MRTKSLDCERVEQIVGVTNGDAGGDELYELEKRHAT